MLISLEESLNIFWETFARKTPMKSQMAFPREFIERHSGEVREKISVRQVVGKKTLEKNPWNIL